jgi:predicted Zn-dependent protease
MILVGKRALHSPDTPVMKITILIFVLAFFASCGKVKKQKSSMATQNVSAIYAANNLSVQVFYEEGSEPYTEGVAGVQIWNLTQANLDALFQGKIKQPMVTVPKDLTQMKKFSKMNMASWSIEDVLKLDKTSGYSQPSGTVAFRIYFVSGASTEGANIIGFHINGEQVMVIFKDTIKGMSGSDPFVPRYVEQATIIHEMGHALGLVNNGVPMVTSHQDLAHGAHCSNSKCVMYWSNEGKSSMQQFAAQAIANQNSVMFDDACLKDSRNY